MMILPTEWKSQRKRRRKKKHKFMIFAWDGFTTCNYVIVWHSQTLKTLKQQGTTWISFLKQSHTHNLNNIALSAVLLLLLCYAYIQSWCLEDEVKFLSSAATFLFLIHVMGYKSPFIDLSFRSSDGWEISGCKIKIFKHLSLKKWN